MGKTEAVVFAQEGNRAATTTTEFFVVEGLSQDVILGVPWLGQAKPTINFETGEISFPEPEYAVIRETEIDEGEEKNCMELLPRKYSKAFEKKVIGRLPRFKVINWELNVIPGCLMVRRIIKRRS